MTRNGTAIPIVLADDHPVFMSGLKGLIQTDPMFEVIKTCEHGGAALKAIMELRPQIAVLDISMPVLTGTEVLAAIRANDLPTRVIFLTASAEDSQIVEAVENGAYGLMLKDSTADTLLECMRSVSTGRRWLSKDLMRPAIEREAAKRETQDKVQNALTPRERELVALVTAGRSNKEIGRLIGTAEGTVKIHLHNIYRKLGVSNRTALTALAHSYRDQFLDTGGVKATDPQN